MKTGIGLPVFPGVSIGPAVVYRKSERTLPVSSGDSAIEQAAIVEVQLLMLEDLDYLDGAAELQAFLTANL